MKTYYNVHIAIINSQIENRSEKWNKYDVKMKSLSTQNDESRKKLALLEKGASKYSKRSIVISETVNAHDPQVFESSSNDPLAYDYKTVGDKIHQNPNKIIIHHTGGHPSEIDLSVPGRIEECGKRNEYECKVYWYMKSMESSHYKRTGGNNTSSLGYNISYHYLIKEDGVKKKYREENEIGRGTKHNNENAIHIVLIGNFEIGKPTPEQKATLDKLIEEIKGRYGEMEVGFHGDMEGEKTSCAGANLKVMYVHNKPEKKKEMTYLGDFNLTQYYSPQFGQSRYFYSHKLGRRRTLGEDIGVNCGYNHDLTLQQNVDACKHPANGMILISEHAKYHGACPPELPLETKLHIEGIGEFVCVDRGTSIVNKKIDVWAGYGEQGIDNIEKGLLEIPSYTSVYVLN